MGRKKKHGGGDEEEANGSGPGAGDDGPWENGLGQSDKGNGNTNGKGRKELTVDVGAAAPLKLGDSAAAFETEEDFSGGKKRHKHGLGICHSITACGTAFLLYCFNLVAFFMCGVIVLGQVAAWEKFDVNSPELVVLGLTIFCLMAVSLLGLKGTCKKDQRRLRMYAFMLLVLILMQVSIINVIYDNLDSGFTDQFLMVIGSLCDLNGIELADLDNITLSGVANTAAMKLAGDDDEKNSTDVQDEQDTDLGAFLVGSGSGSFDGYDYSSYLAGAGSGLLDQLCACRDFGGRKCVAAWIQKQQWYLFLSFMALVLFESLCAVLAWSYVSDLDVEDMDLVMKPRRAKKEAAKAAAAADGGAHSPKDLAQHAWQTVRTVKEQVGVNMLRGQQMHAKARREVKNLTRTWYFEGTVLFACVINVLVLAIQSPTVPPSKDLGIVLRIGELFVALFLTVEVFIEVTFAKTAAERRKMRRDPWVLTDIAVLFASWCYIWELYPEWQRVFSIGRVLRVLRPLRTLRMMGSISIVVETVVSALPLFGQACLLVSFLLMAYSLVGMSLWGGGLHFKCGQPAQNAKDTNEYNCPACVQECSSTCSRIEPPPYIRSEQYGYTGFDNFLKAMLTMFVQMTGDNGMQDVPMALISADIALSTSGWPVMATAVFVLTILALNLFLAVCCSVFDEVHAKVTDGPKNILNRHQDYNGEIGIHHHTTDLQGHVVSDLVSGSSEFEELSLIVTEANMEAKTTAKVAAEAAEREVMTEEEKATEYVVELHNKLWGVDVNSHNPGCRNMCNKIVLSNSYEYFINGLIGVNTLVLMMNHHGISNQWLAINLLIESICLLFFWMEFFLKWIGFGLGTYFRELTNRIDFFVLLCCSAAFIGSAIEAVETIMGEEIAEMGFAHIFDGFRAFTSFRLIKLMRALQLSRWIYSHPTMRGLLETVFRSWEAMILISVFSIFSMVMFAVVAMHLLGGALGDYPAVTLDDYPRRHVETFWGAMLTMFQFLTGEAWSTTMYWYMENNDYIPEQWTAVFWVIVFVWLRCILFSLFVAVLLVNFGVDEDEKVPRQRLKYEREQDEMKLKRKVSSHLLRALKQEQVAADEEDEENSYKALLDADLVTPYIEGQAKDYDRCSLHYFDVSHPFRLNCAKIESHPWFEGVVTAMVLFSCFVIAFESPQLMKKYGYVFDIFNGLLLAIFIAEMVVKFVVHGLYKTSGPTAPYLKDKANRLDMFVVVTVSLTYILPMIHEDMSALRILRLARVLAPMLQLMRNEGLARLIKTFVLAMPAVGTCVALVMIFISIFGIVGVEYFRGKLYRCVDAVHKTPMTYFDLGNGDHVVIENRTMCENHPGAAWENPQYNFDNILQAGMAIFYLSVTAGWVDFMESVIDTTEVGQSPRIEYSTGYVSFFVCFHVVFTFFLLNLFIGVLSSAFAAQSGSNLITAGQRSWIRALMMIKTFHPESAAIDKPEVGVRVWKLRQKMWDLAENRYLEMVWTAGILANVGILMLDHYPADEAWLIFVEWFNLVCLLLFTAEFTIKTLGYGFYSYMGNNWNRLDFFVIIGSWGSKFAGVNAGIGVVRCFRVIRLFLLVKRMPGLMALVDTIVACIKPSIDIAAISSLFFYLYAVIGVKFFGLPVEGGEPNATQEQFTDFLSAMKILFQLINGQTIYGIVYDLRQFGDYAPFIYVASFYFLLVWICENLLVVTVLDNFSVLASMDGDHFSPDELDVVAKTWHDLTYGKVYTVTNEETGMFITDDMVQNLERHELQLLFKEKVEKEEKLRLQKWANFKNSYINPKYRPDYIFNGWLNRPRALFTEKRYFWVSSDWDEARSNSYKTLNWFEHGSSERMLEEKYEKQGKLVVSHGKVLRVHTPLPLKPEDEAPTALDKAIGKVTDEDGHVNKLAAAVSGRPWLVSVANSQRNHPENMMAQCFDLEYYENDLGPNFAGQLPSPIKESKQSSIQVHDNLTPAQIRLLACIEIGVKVPTHDVGIFIRRQNDYRTFWPYFSRVLERVHPGFKAASSTHESDWDLHTASDDANEDSEHFPSFAEVDLQPMPVTLSVSRNFSDFSLVAAMERDDRLKIEDLMVALIDDLISRPEWCGRYVSLTPGHKNFIEEKEYKQLVKDGLMFHPATDDHVMVESGLAGDWPYGRGAYISANEHLTIYVGFEDHVCINSIDKNTTDLHEVLERLRIALLLMTKKNDSSISFMRDPLCGFVNTSLGNAGTGICASADVELRRLTVDGTADRVRETIKEQELGLVVMKREHLHHQSDNPGAAMSFQELGQLGHIGNDLIGDLEQEVHADGLVKIRVQQTCGITEADIVRRLQDGIVRLKQADADEHVLGTMSHGAIGRWIARVWGRFKRYTCTAARKSMQLQREMQELAEESARAMAREMQEVAEASKLKALDAARVAEEGALKSVKSRSPDEEYDNAVFSDSDEDATDPESPHGKALSTDPMAIELDIEIHTLSRSEMDEVLKQQADAHIIVRGIAGELEDKELLKQFFSEFGHVAEVAVTHREADDGENTSYAVIGFATVAGANKALQNTDRDPNHTRELPYYWTTEVNESELVLQRYSDELAQKSFQSMVKIRAEFAARNAQRARAEGTKIKRWRLLADSKEQHDSWLVVLHWLADGCPEPVPHVKHDSRMFPGGIAPRTLTTREWTTLKQHIGLVDLPFTSFREFLHRLQKQGVYGVKRAYDREYVLYATFQMELYAFQTDASDLEQRLSGIESAIDTCDGLNFHHCLRHLGLINCGKLSSLSYEQAFQQYEYEQDFVALQKIKCAVSAWVFRRLHEKHPDKYPHGTHYHWYADHPTIYKFLLRCARDSRLRCLSMLHHLVRRNCPTSKTVDELRSAGFVERTAGLSETAKGLLDGKPISSAKGSLFLDNIVADEGGRTGALERGLTGALGAAKQQVNRRGSGDDSDVEAATGPLAAHMDYDGKYMHAEAPEFLEDELDPKIVKARRREEKKAKAAAKKQQKREQKESKKQNGAAAVKRDFDVFDNPSHEEFHFAGEEPPRQSGVSRLPSVSSGGS